MTARRKRLARTLLVLLVALFFRTWRLDTLPGFNEDESYAAANAARFAAGAPLDPLLLYPHGISQALLGGFQPGYYYLWPAAVLRLFGWSLAAWRASSIALSVAMVLLLYPLGAGVLGERRAFVAALLLAGSRWHAADGRWGWVVVFSGLLMAAGALLTRAGLERRRGPALAAGAAFLGLAVPLYGAAVPTALSALLLAGWKARPRSLFVASLAGLLVGLVPFGVIAFRQPAALMARAAAASVFRDAGPSPVLLFIAGNVIEYAGLFLVHGDPLAWHTLPGTPALDIVSGLAFLAGLGLALRRPRRLGSAWRLSFLGSALAAGLLAQGADAPNQYRVGLAVFFVAILAADGLLTFARAARRRAGRLAGAIVPVAVAASLLLNGRFLFVVWPAAPSLFYAYGGLYTELARDVGRVTAAGRAVWIDPRVLPDPVRLNVALARDLREAADALERPRLPIRSSGLPLPGEARILAPDAVDGLPRADRWGTVLYRVVE